MELSTKKYNFIQELVTTEKENVMEALERVLKREKEAQQKTSPAKRKELDKRLKNSADLLNWQEVKEDR